MRQILQNIGSGETIVEEVPAPEVRPGYLLIASATSLVSAGTERMLLEFGKANLLEKARKQPEKVQMVFDKVRSDGLASTVRAVRSKLDQPIPLGYSNVGNVIGVGAGVESFAIGDRVVSNGHHAEIVSVPKNLCTVIPDEVDDEAAAFTVVSSIALQGIRLIRPTIGENIVVTGLGLIGLLAVQILRANGCNVLGIDPDEDRCKLAESFGALTCCLAREGDPLSKARQISADRGVDGVLITASTSSSDPVHQAATMCRKRGRIVLVGVTGLELSRADFYEKELSFQVSCSYGPGRYDANYEEGGQDYPFGFVRWTEKRNFEAILRLMSTGTLDVRSLITHKFEFSDATSAYKELSDRNSLGIILRYEGSENVDCGRTVRLRDEQDVVTGSSAVVSMIGAGNYASQMLIPALRKTGCDLRSLVSVGGISSVQNGRKFGFAEASTDAAAVVDDQSCNTIVVATRHDSHAGFVRQALSAGKNVFVEKPLAVNSEQLESVRKAYEKSVAEQNQQVVMVGFNRRFAPQILRLKQLLANTTEPKSYVMTVNAGAVPDDHWVHDAIEGGGRIIGEACHFIDLLRFLTDSTIQNVSAVMAGRSAAQSVREDKAIITLQFADGSIGVVNYLANGHRSFPKETLDVFCGGRIIELVNYRKMVGFGWPGFRKMNLAKQDKGHAAAIAAFIRAVESGGLPPIPFAELVEVTQATFDAVKCMRKSEGEL